MDLINVFLLCLMSCIIGGVLMLLLQYVAFVKFFKAPHVETPHDRALNQEFALPENIMCNVKSLDPATKTSIIAFNLIFQFLFYEIRFSTGVRNWIYRKLTNELDELISKTTISKFFDKFLLRDLDLGSQFPEIKNMRVHNVELHDTEGHIESLDVVMDVHYRGNFKVAVDGHMLLGKKVFLAIKVKQLSGLARLQFTRKPYSHWSVCFIGDPALDLDIETLFQGRQLQLQPHLTGLLSHQIRKVVRRKHTLPTYKIRYKPFFSKFTEQFDAAGSGGGAAASASAATPSSAASAQRLSGHLEVNVSELSRLAVPANANHVFCTVTLAAAPWSQVRQVTARTVAVTLVVRIQRAKNQQLGIQFKQRGIDAVYVERLLPNTPASRADLQANDQLLSIGDRPVTNIGQVAKIIKAVAERVIVFRVERVVAGVVQNDSGCDEAFDEYEDMDDFAETTAATAAATPTATGTGSKSGAPEVAKVLRKNSADRTTAPTPSSDSSVANTPSSSPRKPSEPRESVGSLLSLGRKTSRATLKSQPSDASETTPMTRSTQSLQSAAAGSTEQLINDEMLTHTTAAAATPSSEEAPSGSTCGETPVVLHQHTTVNCLVNTLIKLNDLAHFQLTADSKWLNVCVYGRCNEETELLGFVNIGVAEILAESTQSSLWQLVKKFPLNPPKPMSMATHPLSNLKGFEPKLCFGDILMSFVWSGGIFEEDTGGKQPIPTDVVTPGTHDFLRTQFNRSTQCEYCGKKIWLKDAVQCRRCSMSCHKKCVKKCQIFTVCGATADGLTALSATSLLVEQQQQHQASVPQAQQRASVELRLTKSEGNNGGGGADSSGSNGQPAMDGGGCPDALNANCLMTGDQQQQQQQQHQQQQQQQQQQQPSKNSFSDLLAQGIKRVNSVNNLAIPGMGQAGAQFTRSLPPSPQHTPRKQSLVNQSTNPFVAVVLTLEQMSDCVDDLEEEHIVALAQPLIGWGTAEELMGLAKTSSRSLYGDLEPNDRVDKINILLVRLRHVLDVETTYFAQLSAADAKTAVQEGGKFAVSDGADAAAAAAADLDRSPSRRRPSNASLQQQSDEARKAFLVGQSEERVQALSVIMLHLCTGLQYAQGVATQ